MCYSTKILTAMVFGLSCGIAYGWISDGTGQLYTMDTNFPKGISDVTHATPDVRWDTSNAYYVVTDGMTISNWEAADTLLIRPGTVIEFAPGLWIGIEVDGVLRAEGTETDSIVFTSSSRTPVGGDWRDIRFLSSPSDTSSRVSYCRIEYSQLGINCKRSSPTVSHNRIVNSGLYGVVFEGSPRVSHNLIENTSGSGILCGGSSAAVIAHNVVRESQVGGIECVNSASPFIIGNEISGLNCLGIRCADSASPLIVGNTIRNTHWGIAIMHDANPVVGGSLPVANDLWGSTLGELYNTTANTIMAKYNYWGSTDADSLAATVLNYGDGSVVYSPWVNASHDSIWSDPPVADAGGPYSGEEGATIDLDGSHSADDGAIVLYEWDFDGDSIWDETGMTVSHTWCDDCDGFVVIRVTDDGGLITVDSAAVTICNVSPSADAGGPYSGRCYEEIQLFGAGVDPGLDPLTYGWDLDGDGEYDDATVASPYHMWDVAGSYTLYLRVADDDGGVGLDSAVVTVTPETRRFIRGDSNADGEVTVADGIFSAQYLYVPGSTPPPSMKAADTDDSGEIDISDVIYGLKYLYVPGSPEPPFPFPDCGWDPTPDGLEYGSHPCMDTHRGANDSASEDAK